MKKDETVHIDRECTRDVEVHPSTGVGMWGGGCLVSSCERARAATESRSQWEPKEIGLAAFKHEEGTTTQGLCCCFGASCDGCWGNPRVAAKPAETSPPLPPSNTWGAAIHRGHSRWGGGGPFHAIVVPTGVFAIALLPWSCISSLWSVAVGLPLCLLLLLSPPP